MERINVRFSLTLSAESVCNIDPAERVGEAKTLLRKAIDG
jgi:hypothetical protein